MKNTHNSWSYDRAFKIKCGLWVTGEEGKIIFFFLQVAGKYYRNFSAKDTQRTHCRSARAADDSLGVPFTVLLVP